MQISKILATIMVVAVLASPLLGKVAKLKIGDEVPAWKDLPGVDGKSHSFSDLEKSKVIAVVFTCNACPVAQAYVERLSKLAKDYGEKGVVVVAINPNKNEDLKAMTKYAKEKKIQFSYVRDESQRIAKGFGALRTPEVFVLNAKRKLIYHGAIDDDVKLQGKPKRQYLVDAIDAVLAGKQPKKTQTTAMGCAIRWK